MARKQEGRWTNVSKSVYSLVLSDDVVAAVDRAAYGLGTSRSNLINQLLADYVSFITPEKRRKDIFDSLASVLDSFEPFQVQNRGSDSMLCIRSPLAGQVQSDYPLYCGAFPFQRQPSGAAEDYDPHPVGSAHRAAGCFFLPLWTDRAAVYPPAVSRHRSAVSGGAGQVHPKLLPFKKGMQE